MDTETPAAADLPPGVRLAADFGADRVYEIGDPPGAVP
jgi:hypothetical protein